VNWAGRIPGLDAVDFAQYVAPVVSLAVALLAGMGIQTLIEGRSRWVRSVVGAAAIAILIGALVWLNRRLLGSIPKPDLGVHLGVAVVFLAATLGVVLARQRNVLSAGAGSAVVVGLMAGELFALAVLLPLYDSTALVLRPRRHDSFTKPPYVQFLERQAPEYRVLGLNFLLHPNSSMAFGIEDVRGLTATTVRRYWTYVSTFVQSQARPRFTRASIAEVASPSAAGRPLAGNPMLDLLNVRYLLTPAGLPIALEQRLPDGTKVGDQFRQVYGAEVNIYENLHAFPRAFVVHRAVPAVGPDDAVDRMKDPSFDPRRTAVIEGSLSPSQRAALKAAPVTDGSSVTIIHYSDTRVEMSVRMEHPGLLVLGDTYYPGWKAAIDGTATSIHPADEALRSVFVPSGRHTVTFRYSPASFRIGAATTLLSVLGLFVYALWARRRRTGAA
jgi:Bacterial membrane protein YfhO